MIAKRLQKQAISLGPVDRIHLVEMILESLNASRQLFKPHNLKSCYFPSGNFPQFSLQFFSPSLK